MKEQQLLQQLSASQRAAAESQNAIAVREAELQSCRQRLRELEAGSTSSAQDALFRASESENELRILQQRFADLQAAVSNAGAATSKSELDSAVLGHDTSALLEKLSARDAEVEALKQRMSEVTMKEQQLLQQLSASQRAAAESQNAIAAREVGVHHSMLSGVAKEETLREVHFDRISSLESEVVELQASVASREIELESLKNHLNRSLQDSAKSIHRLEADLRFAEESNLRLQQKNEESVELLSSKSSQIFTLQSRLKAAEDKLLPIEARSPEYLALSKEKDALSKKVSSLSSELLKIKEQYLQAISKERLSSLGHVAILEQKLEQSKTMVQQPRVDDGNPYKEAKDMKQSSQAQLDQLEARIQYLQTALTESSAVRSKLESTTHTLNSKLKETQDSFKNLVVYCHDLETAAVSDSLILENEALKLKVTYLYNSFLFDPMHY
jgi:chromosome segregation ATPase